MSASDPKRTFAKNGVSRPPRGKWHAPCLVVGTAIGLALLYDEAKKDGWWVISMKNDWNRFNRTRICGCRAVSVFSRSVVMEHQHSQPHSSALVSALPPKADTKAEGWRGSFGPKADSCTAA
jgi:hypothetical protein